MATISLENRIAVHELIARYSHEVDNYRGEAWADLFLEDGKLVGIEEPLVGRQGFLGQVEKLLAGATEYRHSITNIYLEDGATDERAVARAYGLVSDWATRPPLLSIFADYRFEVVRVGECWKIKELTVNMPYAE